MRLIFALLACLSALSQTSVVTYPFPQHQPTAWQIAGGTPFNTVALSASGDRYGTCFQVLEASTLNSIGFATRTVTTGDTVRVSFQDVDPATGLPDGTDDQYRDVVINSTDDNVWKQSGIVSSDGTDTGTKRTVSARDRLCIVIAYPSYVAGNLQIASINVEGSNKGIPNGQVYNARFTASAWTKNANDGPNFAIEKTDGTYGYLPGVAPYSNASSSTYNSGSAFDEAGNRVQYPVAVSACGVWANFNSAADVDLVLYDSAGTALGTATIDKDITATTGQKLVYGYFACVNLAANTTYYVMVKPSSATNVIVPYADASTAAHMAASVAGAQTYSATRVDAGSFTTTATRFYAVGLLVSGIQSGGGSVGGVFVSTN